MTTFQIIAIVWVGFIIFPFLVILWLNGKEFFQKVIKFLFYDGMNKLSIGKSILNIIIFFTPILCLCLLGYFTYQFFKWLFKRKVKESN